MTETQAVFQPMYYWHIDGTHQVQYGTVTWPGCCCWYSAPEWRMHH